MVSLCPFCLNDCHQKIVAFQCAARGSACKPVVDQISSEIWAKTAPQPLIFHESRSVFKSKTAQCPQCQNPTSILCCPHCHKNINPLLLTRNSHHIAIITHKPQETTSLIHDIISRITQHIAPHKDLLVTSFSETAPFSLTLQKQKEKNLFVFHVLKWEDLKKPQFLQALPSMMAHLALLPYAPSHPLEGALHYLQAHLNNEAPLGLVIQNAESLISYLPPNHIFFRPTPLTINSTLQEASLAISQSIRNLVQHSWSTHAVNYIEKFFPKNRFFIYTNPLQKKSTTPKGWRVDDIVYWIFNSANF